MIDWVKRNPLVWYQGPMIMWAILLFVASSIPGDDIPDFGFFTHDKLLHFLMYVVFAATVYRGVKVQRRFSLLAMRPYLFTCILVALYGASDEIHQYFVPNRTSSFYDWLADSAGGVVFIAAHWLKARLKPEPHAV